jgi:uncharacterized flavoprotein (TIGR03862 family)
MNHTPSKHITIIGAGPSGLMAAEICANAGLNVTVYDRMRAPARKFLMAGRGGLNLTHSEDLECFIKRYGDAAPRLASCIEHFPPTTLRAWCEGLGIETFIGSSGRIFPTTFKASPLLRAWLQRLDKMNVRFALRHDWRGWDDVGALLFNDAEDKKISVTPDATLLALGGASWPRLGADGGWVNFLKEKNISVSPLRPANCGFAVDWTPHFIERFEGHPLKTIALSFANVTVQGEMMITKHGVEGGAIYAHSSALREAIAQDGTANPTLDLRKDISADDLTRRLQAGRGSQSLSTFLKKAAGLSPLAIGLIQEASRAHAMPIETAAQLSHIIKHLPLRLTAPFPIDRAISSAGGIMWDEIDEHYGLKKIPRVFIAGEMLDWEAPTGGYLLQGCFSTAVAAARGVIRGCDERA